MGWPLFLIISSAASMVAPVGNPDEIKERLAWPANLAGQYGALRQGLACLPAGRFSLHDLVLPTEKEIMAIVPPTVRGEVLNLEMAICRAYMGIGKAPTSRVKLEVRWQDSARQCHSVVAIESVTKRSDGRKDSRPLLDAVRQSYNNFDTADEAHSARCLRE